MLPDDEPRRTDDLDEAPDEDFRREEHIEEGLEAAGIDPNASAVLPIEDADVTAPAQDPTEPGPPTPPSPAAPAMPSQPATETAWRRARRRLGKMFTIAGACLIGAGIFFETILEVLFVPLDHPLIRPFLLEGRLAVLAIGAVALVAGTILRKSAPVPMAREAELEAMSVKSRGKLALSIFLGFTFFAIRWWTINGAPLMARLGFYLNVWTVYWNQVATPSEKYTWYAIFLCGAGFIVLVLWLAHRFVWRSFFPDLVRMDPTHHRGSRSEPLGRLFKIRPFIGTAEEERYRLYYKHGSRTFPIFRFDFVDVDVLPQMSIQGVAQIRVGRLIRDPQGHSFRRLIATDRYGSHPLLTSFREGEIVEDHNRKTSIVMPGSAMNPQVMRRKFENERLINPQVARRKRDRESRPMNFPRPHREGGRRTGPDAHVDRLDEPAPE